MFLNTTMLVTYIYYPLKSSANDKKASNFSVKAEASQETEEFLSNLCCFTIVHFAQ